MNHATVERLLYITLFCGLFPGLSLLMFWIKLIFRFLLKSIESLGHINLVAISLRAFVHMLSGLCTVSMLYFGHLLKRVEYCLQIIKVNKGMEKDNLFLLERCGCLDIDELFAKGATTER